MKRFYIFLLVFIFTLPAMAAGEKKLKVAVFDPTASGQSIDEGAMIAIREIISSTIVNTGRYDIVERSLLEKVMQEQSFSNSGAVDDSQITEIGKLAGADKIVLTVVSSTGGRCVVSVKMIDVMTANIDRQRVKIFEMSKLLESIEPMTLSLVDAELNTDYSVMAGFVSEDEKVAEAGTEEVVDNKEKAVSKFLDIFNMNKNKAVKDKAETSTLTVEEIVKYSNRKRGRLYMNGDIISADQYKRMCMTLDKNLWEQYRKGTTYRKSGVWLMSIGAGIVFTGMMVMIDDEVIGGSLIGVGSAVTIAGVPLYCIGVNKRRRSVDGFNSAYSRKYAYTATLNLGISDVGVGLALNF